MAMGSRRTTPTWPAAAAVVSDAMAHPSANSGEWPTALAEKVFLFPESFRERIRAPFSRIWFYIGWMYDPSLNFTAGANRQEYFLQHLVRHDDLHIHGAFIRGMTFAHVNYGRNERFAITNRLGTPLPNGQVVANFGGGMNGMAGAGFFRHPYFRYEREYPEDLSENFRHFVINDLRARIYALEASLLRGDKTENLERRLERFDGYAEGLEEYETPERWPELEQDVQRIRQLLEEAEGEIVASTATENTSMVYRGSHPDEELPLEIPEYAYDKTPSPFGEVYDQYCAGCHGQFGEGHAGGGEIAGKGLTFAGYPRLREYPSWGGFQAYVRHGIDSEVVKMPSFSRHRISDEDLRTLWEALNDTEKLRKVDQ